MMQLNVVQPKVALTKNVELADGAHVLYTYSDKEKYIENAVSFIATGLTLKHGVAYIDNPENFEFVLDKLEQKGYNKEQLATIVFLDSVQFYGANDIFSIKSVFQQCVKVNSKLEESKKPFRTWANVKWMQQQCCLQEKINEYELKSDKQVSQNKSFAICAYDGNLLPANIQIDLMKSHPYIMTDTELVPSNFYNKDSQILSIFLEEQLEEKYEEFQVTNSHYKNLIEEMPDAVVVTSNGNILYANKATVNLLTYNLEELLNKTVWEISDPSCHERIHKRIAILQSGEKAPPTEVKLVTSEGDILDVEIVCFPFAFEGLNQPAFISILRNVTERNALEKNLMLAKINAEKANEMKNVFLSQMSHDLRTPLNSIQGFTQLLMSSEDRNEEEQFMLQKVLGASNHLLELIAELLDFSAIEAGTIKISPETIHLKSFIDDCVNAIPIIKPHVYLYTLPIEEDLYIKADPIRLKQILNNLLNNAIKYNKPGGVVKISVENRKSDVKILIKDNGIGIPTNEIKYIFDPFYRSDRFTEQWKGTGLGLAIVAKLTTKMDGTYGVKSEEGFGTTFWVAFSKVDKVELNSSLNVQEKMILPEHNSIQKDVLYIEDNLENIIVMKAMLKAIGGVNLTIETKGKSGFVKAFDQRPDIILLDLGLPDIKGIDVLKILKAEESTRDIPIIVVSANALESSVKEALKIGADDYITKPIDLNKLRTAIIGS